MSVFPLAPDSRESGTACVTLCIAKSSCHGPLALSEAMVQFWNDRIWKLQGSTANTLKSRVRIWPWWPNTIAMANVQRKRSKTAMAANHRDYHPTPPRATRIALGNSLGGQELICVALSEFNSIFRTDPGNHNGKASK